jgi:hypothetical protein
LSSMRTPPTLQYRSRTSVSMYLPSSGDFNTGSIMKRQK